MSELEYVKNLAIAAKRASKEIAAADTRTKNTALRNIAQEIRRQENEILIANEQDVALAKEKKSRTCANRSSHADIQYGPRDGRWP